MSLVLNVTDNVTIDTAKIASNKLALRKHAITTYIFGDHVHHVIFKKITINKNAYSVDDLESDFTV